MERFVTLDEIELMDSIAKNPKNIVVVYDPVRAIALTTLARWALKAKDGLEFYANANYHPDYGEESYVINDDHGKEARKTLDEYPGVK